MRAGRRGVRGARLILGLCLLATGAGAETFRAFAGHGGPVMDVALSDDGRTLVTGSFDNSVGVWRIDGSAGPVWLEGHDAAVTTVDAIGNDRVASGGDDFAVMVWRLAGGEPLLRLSGHGAKVTAVAAAPDGGLLASASWDGTVRLWDTGTGRPAAVLVGHRGGVNDVVWSADGRRLYTAGQDGRVLVWDAATGAFDRQLAAHGFGINRLALDPGERWIVYGALDGGTHVLRLPGGEEIADLSAGRRPILGLSLSADAERVAVGDGEGHILVAGTGDWSIERDFRAAVSGPIWALAFTASGAGVIAGGLADEAFLWPLEGEETGDPAGSDRPFHVDPSTVGNGERQFLRKCSVCHALTADGGRRAGPTLHALFGRRAGTVPGYGYSAALAGNPLVWTEATIDALFALGPDRVTPGSKMPVQRIASPQDRADLIAFLKGATKPH